MTTARRRRRRSSAPVALLVLMALAAPVPGAPPASRPTTAPAAAAASLESDMKAMNRAFKAIGRQLDDASKDAATLKLVAELKAATEQSKEQLPDAIAKLDGDAKAKATADYERLIDATLAAETDLEKALAAGDRAAAKSAYQRVDQTMREGHKAYRPKR